MELRQLECFVAVAEELHFGRAAARLRMTQPPLSRQIQLLEEAIGVTLFDRTSRSVRLTTPGRVFLREARSLLHHGQRAALDARMVARGDAGQIALGFTAVAAYRLMPSLLGRARQALPDVHVQLREMVSADLSRLLLAGELDVVLARQLPAGQGIHTERLEREPMVLALPAASPLADYATVPLTALHGQPFIIYSPEGGRYFHHRIAGVLASHNIVPRFVQHTSQTHTLLALVRAGLGVGIVPDTARELRLDGLVYRPLDPDVLHAEMLLAWREDHENPAIDAFVRCVLPASAA